jgi:outer membrane biogenesis lipoprotein LolB
MMMRGMIFILVLFFLAGCGMSGSKTEGDSKGITTEDSVANTDLNISDDSMLIAVVDEEETKNELEEDSILPQTFSINFPTMLKKSTTDINETNQTIEVIENNQTVDADETN